MSDIFISYSRKDTEFGRRLHAKLTEEKHNIWMDWEDIPPTAEWWTKIQAGCLAADNVVILISPDSIASPICNLEIAYARELNKRFVPILHRNTDESQALVALVTHPLSAFQSALLQDKDLLVLGRDNWKALAGLNWINFTDEAAFEEKVQELLQAIDTDLDYVDEHTRLLVRTADWENRKRSPSLLLRDDDLTAAESWLESAGHKNPQPTSGQRAYIVESRRVETELQEEIRQQEQRTRQLQRATAVFAVMLLLALIVSVLAGLTTINAQATQATVESQATLFALEQERAQVMLRRFGIVPTYEGATPLPPTLIALATSLVKPVEVTANVREDNGAQMVEVPAGCFLMGSVIENAEPVNRQCVKTFWLDQFEVSRQRYRDCVVADACNPIRINEWSSRPIQPVNNVTWGQAHDYCEWREARLPTEVEWEYAARGPDSRTYPWGDEFEPDRVIFARNHRSTTANLGGRESGASWVGAEDMSGNVWEWVSTIFGEFENSTVREFSYPYNPDDGREDQNRTGVVRIRRGGSFDAYQGGLRLAERDPQVPDNVLANSGFRCARDA